MHQERPDLDPPDSCGAYSTGVTFMKRQAWDEAAAWFLRAAELEPPNLAVHLDWGEALVRLGRFRDAASLYQRMARICSDGAEKSLCLYLSGAALLRADEAAAALVELDQALSLRSAFVEALGLRGLALERLGHHPAAGEAYERALAACPQYFERWPVAFEGTFLVSLPELRVSYARVMERT
jgi:tetratricopeptide (TPR) repeat protein